MITSVKAARVIDGEKTKYNVTNVFPEGAKGLAASRWATPAQPTPPSKPAQPQPGLVQRTPNPSAAQPQTAAQTKTIITSVAAARVIDGEKTKYNVINVLPPGAKGLAASRWATPAQPAPPRAPKTVPARAAAPPAAKTDAGEFKFSPKEVDTITMVNKFPPGAKGLKASRWA